MILLLCQHLSLEIYLFLFSYKKHIWNKYLTFGFSQINKIKYSELEYVTSLLLKLYLKYSILFLSLWKELGWEDFNQRSRDDIPQIVIDIKANFQFYHSDQELISWPKVILDTAIWVSCALVETLAVKVSFRSSRCWNILEGGRFFLKWKQV